MALKDLLKEIDSLKNKIDSSEPIDKENQIELEKKFKLEWNYNSNHIEGNTLTYRETTLLILNDKVTGDHDARDIEEMKAHEVARRKIEEYAEDKERPIGLSDIRDLNRILLVKPYKTDGQPVDGIPTKVEIIPGEYKTLPNYVPLNDDGDVLTFTLPEDVPNKMEELIEWYRTIEKDNKIHPVIVASQLHYKFVRIHPFSDGNGRVSRLLLNYHLIKNGYPPVIIKSIDKDNYLTALSKADAGMGEAIDEYIAKELIWSLEIKLKAINGESLEEENDIYKQIKLLKQRIKKGPEFQKRSWNHINNIYHKSLMPLFVEIDDIIRKELVELYTSYSSGVGFGSSYKTISLSIIKKSDEYSKIENIYTKLNAEGEGQSRYNVYLDVVLSDYKYNGSDTFGYYNKLKINFDENFYQLEIAKKHGDNKVITTSKKLYTEFISKETSSLIITTLLKDIYQNIEEKSDTEN